MLSCAFFGHRDLDYSKYHDLLEKAIEELIKRGFTHFCHGNRGRFEGMCASILIDLREKYPHIQHILVLSYVPDENFVLPYGFDSCTYLLTKNTPKRYAIWYTNKQLINIADCMIVAVNRDSGGAKRAYDYAQKLDKPTFNILS